MATALKPDRLIKAYLVNNYLNTAQTAGKVVCFKSAASGANLDHSYNEVQVIGAQSGAIPVGMLLEDVVDIDATRFQVNLHKPEVLIGSKVSIAKQGWLVTNAITGVVTAGTPAVLANSGYLTSPQAGWNVTHQNFPSVGKWETNPDTDGYARVYINL